MCDPISITAAVTAASTVATYAEQAKRAKTAARKYDELVLRVTEGASKESAEARVRQMQEREAVVADVIAAEERAREAFATARVSQSEAGVVGPSAEAYLQQFAKTELATRFRGEKQLEAMAASADFQQEAYVRGLREQLIGAQPGIAAPSPVDLGLGLTSTAVDYYGNTQDLNNPEIR